MPVPLQAARGGVQPTLSLSYSTGAGLGIAGMGWSIGTQFIARQVDRGTPRYDDRAEFHPNQDRFIMNGAELVPLGTVHGSRVNGTPADEVMPPWAEGWQYFRPRVEGQFARVFWSPDHRTWRVQAGQGGLSMEFGVPLDGHDDTNALETATEGDTSRIFRWNLARSYDAAGTPKPLEAALPQPANVVVYRYRIDGGVGYLSDIFDTPPANHLAAPLSQYAHHTHLSYQTRQDSLDNYRRGFRVSQALRVTSVDLTSKPAGTSFVVPRRQVRRVWLSYAADSRLSLLTSVQTEGRCSGVETDASVPAENGAQLLPTTSACAKLPPLSFNYTSVPISDSVPTEPGLTSLSQGISTIAGSPANALDRGAGMALLDFNGDGLPDVLDGDSAKYVGKHRVYLNGQDNQLGKLSAATNVAIPSIANSGARATGFDLSLKNPNVVSLDFDSNGSVDLVYMPRLKRPVVFSARPDAGAFQWAGRVPDWSISQTTPFELASVAPTMRSIDVNGDGFIDLVQTSGSELLTYFSLTGFPGGDGKFGQAVRNDDGSVQFLLEPARACLPAGDGLVLFNDPLVKVADLNGDGLADIVRARRGQVNYWPGRGDGHFGEGDLKDCQTPNIAPSLSMAGAPIPSAPDESLVFGDVNGDGLADAIAMEATSITVWLNKSGTSFAKPVSVPKPTTATNRKAVQLADVNGSGTADVVFGDAGNYRYVDLLGGTRPHLLASIESGFGKTTEIQYSTSTNEMMTAAAAGKPWASVVPLVVPVVKRIVIHDNLNKVGRPAGVYTTEYEYRDPSYDPRDRAFRGFHEVIRRQPAAGLVSQASRTLFLMGECVDDVSAGQCAKRDFDNPREALKGVASTIEAFNSSGEYLSTTFTTHRLRTLYSGLDGRQVRTVFPVSTDVYKYETTPFSHGVQVLAASAVEHEITPGVVVPEAGSLVLRSTNRVHLRGENETNRLGQMTLTRSRGCIEGCGSADEIVHEGAVIERVPGDLSGWFYRTTQTWTVGSVHTAKRNEFSYAYDAAGRQTVVSAKLSGTLPLVRLHASGGATAPVPSQASWDGTIVVKQTNYDPLGQISAVRAGIGRCAERQRDARYDLLIEEETALVGAPNTEGCGTVRLTNRASFDFGFQTVVQLQGANGEKSRVELDDFGRLVRGFAPDPTNLGAISPLPGSEYSYLLPTDGKPIYGVRSRIHRGADLDSNIYVENYDYADSLGRGVLTLSPADPAKGDPGQWIVNGLVEYDALGRQTRGYLPWYWTGDPLQFPLQVPGNVAFEVRRYDGFGRVSERQATDGVLVAKSHYHPMSTDTWDAEDLKTTGLHRFTPSTSEVDGHGRPTVAVSRFKVGTVLRQLIERIEYLPTGEALRMSRTLPGVATPVISRWMRYDSLGRMVLNVEPNTSTGFVDDINLAANSIEAWRYAYNDVGDLVGTSDARGCGANFFFDAAGRSLAVDRSPCLANQPAYSPINLATGAGAETWKRYDAPDSELSAVVAAGCPTPAAAWLGKLASVETLGAKDMTLIDARGRTTCVATRVATPGANAAANRNYAPRWYTKVIDYDAGNRAIATTTGARTPELLGTGNASWLSVNYSKRDKVYSVDSSYGTLLTTRELDVTGRPKKTVYGDLAQTKTEFSYDERHRLASVQTTRVAPSLWQTPTGQYQAPTDPNEPVRQTVLENSQVTYDDSDNPIGFYDLRDPAEWPVHSKPVNRYVEYDDLNRVSRVRYDYGPTADSWHSPYAKELSTPPDPAKPRPEPAPHVSFSERFKEQKFSYDHLGNIVHADDDAHGFYDRSIGDQTVGSAALGPYQLRTASNRAIAGAGPRAGNLDTRYDAAGNLTDLLVLRDGPCLPLAGSCKQRFTYEWNEIGQLTRARRWDLAPVELPLSGVLSGPLPARNPDVELRYTFGQGGLRTLKTAIDPSGQAIHDLYIFDTLEVRQARFDSSTSEYELNARTERVLLRAAGQALGRVHYSETDVPHLISGSQHILLELKDHLGSNTAVVDYATGELVEATSYAAYGQTETDYRPERWGAFREPYKFSGKEDDIEVGLTYVGQRFYSPQLGRWISPDPLAVHKPGQADVNVYAYVNGRTFSAVDPDGQLAWFIPILIGIAISAAINVAQQQAQIHQAQQSGQQLDFSWGSLGMSVGIAAISGGAGAGAGALAGSLGASAAAAGVISNVASGVVSSGLNGAANQAQNIHQGGSWNWKQFGGEVGMGFASSAIGAGVGVGALKLGVGAAASAGLGGFAGGMSGSAMSQSATNRSVNWGVAAMQGAASGAIGYGTSVALQKFGAVPPEGCSCFAAGTLVATSVGLIPIERVQVGDLVLSRDEQSGVTEYKPVARLFVHDDRELLQLGFSLPDGTSETIVTTPNHPFYVKGRGWVQAGQLPIDTAVATQAGLAKLSTALSMIERGRVFNLEVADFHTYFVGRGLQYVHNACPCGPTKPGTPGVTGTATEQAPGSASSGSGSGSGAPGGSGGPGGTQQAAAPGSGADGSPPGSKSDIVFRVIRPDENPAAGLVAKDPQATYTIEGFVRHGSREGFASQYIAATRSADVAARRAAESGNRVVVFDLSQAEGTVTDLSSGGAGILRSPITQNYSRSSAEVVIEGRVPPNAILFTW